MPITSNTNVLALPLAAATIVTGTNEDWLDAFKYLAGPPPGEGMPDPPPLDLRGIEFEMMVRRTSDDAEVIVWASTSQGSIQIGPTPDFNYLIINVPIETMITRTPGEYIGDMVAKDATWTRTIMNINLTIVDGITK